MNITELCDLLDQKISKAIEECKKEANMPPNVFHGTVTGFLLKTAIGRASLDGLSNNALRVVVDKEIEKVYRGG